MTEKTDPSRFDAGANPQANPRTEYERRLEARKGRVASHEARHILLSNIRVAVFVLFLVLLWMVFWIRVASPWWLVAPVAIFLGLIVVHENVLKAKRRAGRSVGFYKYALDRLDDRWMGRGQWGERFRDPEHPYEPDLDLFGTGSLFELLSQARTRAGEERLAGWLLHAPESEKIRERQSAVDELRDRIELREGLALLGAEMEVGVHPQKLLEWSAAPPLMTSRPSRGIAFALSLLAILGVVGWAAWGFGAAPFLAVIMAQVVYRMILHKRFNKVAGTVDHAASDLLLLAEVLEVIEREKFESPLLHRIAGALEMAGSSPSVWTKRLVRLVDCLEARKNSLFAPISYPLLWDFHFAFAIESWRAKVGAAIPRWLDAVAEFEALCSLAGYAYERADEPFAEIVDDGGIVFEGEQIGHPLLPEAVCIRNDLRLDQDQRLFVVSGSNMSGKSTLLRTVGTLVALGLAGAPVRARRLRLSRFALGASIRVQDSIQSGVSRFYAEIRRMRKIVELTEDERPVCFLIDEILQGTNSHDRKIGVQSVMASLLERGAIGLITTHDLALTKIVEPLGSQVKNVHFEDQLIDGEMHFDYSLRPGVVQRSNALGLMRAVGLDV